MTDEDISNLCFVKDDHLLSTVDDQYWISLSIKLFFTLNEEYVF